MLLRHNLSAELYLEMLAQLNVFTTSKNFDPENQTLSKLYLLATIQINIGVSISEYVQQPGDMVMKGV